MSQATVSPEPGTGNLFSEVTDSLGQVLPGAKLTLSGKGPPLVSFSDDQGLARFLGVKPGDYELVGKLDGFQTVDYPNVRVADGRNTTLEMQMTPVE